MLIVMAVALFASLAWYLRELEARAVGGHGLDDQFTGAGELRPLAEVARLLRQCKLVTVEINTKVLSGSTHESWRGDVEANVEVPVRLLYGTDLSALSMDALAFSPVARAYLVRIPPPERIATEVVGSDEDIAVRLGWLRSRSLSGEYHLGLARRGLYERAREMTLSHDDAQMVRETTREEVAALVKRLVGERAAVEVVFSGKALVAGAGE